MPSSFRIPQARLTGAYGRLMAGYARRTYGQIPDVGYVLFHNKPVLRAVLGFERKVQRWHALDPTLTSYAEIAAAAVIGCSWCLDFGYYKAHNDKLDLAKVSQVPRWRDSAVFSAAERDVLEYAEAMTSTPPTVTDALVSRLLDALGTAAVVELTQVIALENMRSRFNSAAGLASQGYSDVCAVPLATAAAVSRTAGDR